MSTKAVILLIDTAKELEQILKPHEEKLHFKLKCAQNRDALPMMAQELHPNLIIVNTSDPSLLCHRLKMNTSLFQIPIFLFIKQNDDDIELQFLSNELFKKPFEETQLLSKIATYLKQSTETENEKTFSKTKERWIEKKTKQAYTFEYEGTISTEKILALKNRIEELITIGRRDFTINLLHSQHLENVSALRLIKLNETIRKNQGHLKIITHLSPLTEELADAGIDTDEYVEKEAFKHMTEKKRQAAS